MDVRGMTPATGTPIAGHAPLRMEITLTRSRASAGIARTFVKHKLTAWGLKDLISDAQVIVTELFANGLKHTNTPLFICGLSYNGGRPVLEMWDESFEMPRELIPDYLAETGRGIHIINSLSVQWGVRRAVSGKCVWAVLI